ncbi:MAG: hypothetical protein ACOC2W_01495 [bacterium]
MDNKQKILLNSSRNVNEVNIDSFTKIDLKNNVSNINEYNVYDVVNATNVFELERENTEIYRFYGQFEYFSLFNGLRFDYTDVSDFFDISNRNRSDGRDLLNTFDVYIVKPSVEYIENDVDNNIYQRKFEIIATPDNIDIFPVGYSKNIFDEQKYGYVVNMDFDISEYRDYFGFPCTELFFYFVFKPETNGLGDEEVMHQKKYAPGFFESMSYEQYNIGDIVEGDLIKYDLNNYSQSIESEHAYFIKTTCNYNGEETYIRWEYNPFIPIRLRYFSSEVNVMNTGTTVYDQAQSIPSYAKPVDDKGNYIWRDILPQGFIDPITNDGVDYPFVNKRRYLFGDYKIIIKPNMLDSSTSEIFNEIKFNEPTIINKKPITNIDNFNKPCQ